MRIRRLFCLLLVITIVVSGCNLRINKSITVDDGRTVRGSQNTVNGSIYIGSDCKINGNCRSVNGVIRVGSDSRVKDLQAVNGKITVERNVLVKGKIESVNGSVSCDQGVEVYKGVTTVNGSIDLESTMVEQDLNTYNGDITLSDESTVRGDIVVKKSKGRSRRRRRLTIEITEDSVVEGDIIVKDRTMDVKVILSQGGRVEGRIKNAEVIEE
jgi:DUF4097 and DUF4098 domain-containing protein YvlB